MVDDEPASIELAKIYLARYLGGFIIRGVDNAQKAVGLLQSESYDVIVSDYQMPGMHGIELLRLLRGKGVDVPFILFTGRGREEVVIQALNSGADFYLQKSGDPELLYLELSNMIKKLSESHQDKVALRQSEEAHRTLFQKNPLAAVITRMDGRFIEVNEMYLKLCGLKREEVIGRNAVELGLVDERTAQEIMSSLAMEKGVLDHRELRPLDNDGNPHDIVISANVINYMGEPHVQTILNDVTDLEMAKKKLQERNEELDRERRILQSISDNVPGAVFQVTFEPDSLIKVLFMSKGAENLVHMPISTWYTDPERFVAQVHDDDIEPLLRSVRDAALGHDRWSYDFRVYDVDGSMKWIHASAGLTSIDATRQGVWTGSFTDISDRKQVEEAMRSRERMANLAMELANLADWDYEAATNEFVFNDRLYALYATSAEKEGGYRMDASVYIKEFIHPEDVERVRTFMMERDSSPHIPQLEHRIVRRDGEVRYIVTRVDVITDASGNVIRARGVNQDITERKMAENALAESEEKFRTFFDQSVDGIVILDLQGRIIDWNSALEKMTGLSKKEASSMPAWEMIYRTLPEGMRSPETLERVKASFLSMQAETFRNIHTQYCAEFVFKGKDGQLHYGHETIFTIKVHDGIRMGMILRDITERKMMEESLVRAQDRIALLSRITRHDIGNQLTIEEGFLSLLKQRCQDDVSLSYAQHVEDAIRHIRKQIDFTKAYQDLGRSKPAWHSIKDITRYVREGHPSIDMVFAPEMAELSVLADPMLPKVFHNLVEDTVKYGGHPPSIKIGCQRSGDALVIVYEDKGPGIPSSDKEKIFEKGALKESGVGLFLSKQILDITGISIKENGEPGTGVRFEITVPQGKFRFEDVGPYDAPQAGKVV